MFTEEQKHYTGRAMIALAGVQRSMLEAVEALMEFAPDVAAKLGERMARDAEIASGLIRLALAAAPCGNPMSAERDALAQIIWETSRADEGSISATGANIVSAAILAAGYRKVPSEPMDENPAQVPAWSPHWATEHTAL